MPAPSAFWNSSASHAGNCPRHSDPRSGALGGQTPFPRSIPRKLRAWCVRSAAAPLCCSPDFCSCAAKLASPFRLALLGSVCLAGFRFGRQVLPTARRRAPGKLRGFAQLILRWSSITTAARCAAACSRGVVRGPRLMRSICQRCSICSERSTGTAATYLQRILTAGSPAGVSTCSRMRQRAVERARRPAAK